MVLEGDGSTWRCQCVGCQGCAAAVWCAVCGGHVDVRLYGSTTPPLRKPRI